MQEFIGTLQEFHGDWFNLKKNTHEHEIFSRIKHTLTVFLRTTTIQANGDVSLGINFLRATIAKG